MRVFWLLSAGCVDPVCPQSAPLQLTTAPGTPVCATEGEPCGRDTACALGTTCVSELLCTVGPCPGWCRVGCEVDDDCRSDEVCEAPASYADSERYCLS